MGGQSAKEAIAIPCGESQYDHASESTGLHDRDARLRESRRCSKKAVCIAVNSVRPAGNTIGVWDLKLEIDRHEPAVFSAILLTLFLGP